MNLEQQRANLTIALPAARTDGSKDDREQEQIRQLVESLGSNSNYL